MFEKFIGEEQNSEEKSLDNIKDTIYKTYSKIIERAKEESNTSKQRMSKMMNLLIYLQMKKVELKLSYFNDFDKLIQFETQQIKSMENQIIQDRVKLAIKKSEINDLSHKFQEIVKLKKEGNETNLPNNPSSVDNHHVNLNNINA